MNKPKSECKVCVYMVDELCYALPEKAHAHLRKIACIHFYGNQEFYDRLGDYHDSIRSQEKEKAEKVSKWHKIKSKR